MLPGKSEGWCKVVQGLAPADKMTNAEHELGGLFEGSLLTALYCNFCWGLSWICCGESGRGDGCAGTTITITSKIVVRML